MMWHGQTHHPEPSLRRPALDTDFDDPAGARSSLESWLGSVEAGSQCTIDAVLAASELLTNAVEHGSAAPAHLQARRVGYCVVLTIRNRTRRVPAVPEPDDWTLPADPLALTGRGLGIVAALVSTARVVHDEGWLIITVTLEVDAAEQ